MAEALDEPATSSRTDDAVEAGWSDDFRMLLDGSDSGGPSGDELAADGYLAAADAIADNVLAAYYRFGGDVDELSPDHASDVERAREAYTLLRQMVTEADLVEDLARSSEIRAALEEIDELTCRYVVELGNVLGETTSDGSDTLSWNTTWDTSGTSSGPDGPAEPPSPNSSWSFGNGSDGSTPGSASGSAPGADGLATTSRTDLETVVQHTGTPPGMRSSQQQPSFGGTQASDTQSTTALPEGWHAPETPGFGRQSADPAHLPMSRREAFVNSVKRGEVIPDETLRTLSRSFAGRTMDATITPDQYSWAAMQDMLGDLQDVADRARASNLTSGDYSGLTPKPGRCSTRCWRCLTKPESHIDAAGSAGPSPHAPPAAPAGPEPVESERPPSRAPGRHNASGSPGKGVNRTAIIIIEAHDIRLFHMMYCMIVSHSASAPCRTVVRGPECEPLNGG